MRAGRTYTRHLQLEGRQHELFGVDLGEGVPRSALAVGFAAYAVWLLPLLLLFGLPTKATFTFYVAVPGLVAMYGYRHSKRNERRRNLAVWIIWARYRLLGHRPVINGGRRTADRCEWIPRHLRRTASAGAGRRTAGPVAAGPPIVLDARPRLYGPDVVYKATRRHLPKPGKGVSR